MCLQKLVTNLLAGWDLDQDGKVEIHEIMYVLDEFCGATRISNQETRASPHLKPNPKPRTLIWTLD